MIELKLEGHIDVIEAFREFREELPKNPMRKATRAAAQLLADAIAQVTPVRTGRLLESIAVTSSTANHITHGRVVINKAGFYWRFLELGWHSRGGSFHQHEFIAPRVRSMEQQAAQKVIDECEAQVKQCQDKIVRSSAGGF